MRTKFHDANGGFDSSHPIPGSPQGSHSGFRIYSGSVVPPLTPSDSESFFFNHALLNLAGSYRGHTVLKKSQKTSIGLNFNSAVTRYMTFNISSPPETGSSSVLRR